MKMRGSYYPYCSSSRRSFSKGQTCSGIFQIEDHNLVFRAKILLWIPIKKYNLTIPLNEIEMVEAMNLNGVMPFGVCLYMKDNKEYMMGHINNKKMAKWIMDAIEKNKKIV